MNHHLDSRGPAPPAPGLPGGEAAGWKGQFGCPTGPGGRLAGRLMAVKNARMNRLVADRLAVGAGDRVLEIGFGPGVLIQELARRASFVAGADPSAVMVRQAAARNRAAIREGRVDLARAPASNLPYEAGRFTKVCEVNSFHHWPDAVAGLREARRVLAEDGVLLLGLRMRHPTRSFLVAPGYTENEVAEAMRLVERAGFRDLRTEKHEAGRAVTLLFARR